jgi:transketolase
MDYESKLRELALRDERLVVMTAENRAAIRGLPAVLGERFVDTGITEQAMIGAAAGLALRGRVPVAHALATFLTLRAFEFIRTDVGIAGLPVKLVGAVPGFLSDGNGPTHQALEDVALMRGIPNLDVFAPADAEDMVMGLESFLGTARPGYLRYNPRPAVHRHAPFVWGMAETVGQGEDVALLVYGTLFTEAMEAKRRLEEKGLSVGLVNLRTVKPFDEATVLEAMRRARLTVTIEDHFLTGGLYSVIAETALRNRLTAAHVLPIALDNTWFKPALLPDVLEYEGFTGAKMAEKIYASFQRDRSREG